MLNLRVINSRIETKPCGSGILKYIQGTNLIKIKGNITWIVFKLLTVYL